MIKCNLVCPTETFDGCCFFCDVKACKDRCSDVPSNCDDAIMLDDVATEQNADKALEAFKGGQLAILQNIANIVQQKKELEAQETDLKVKLQESMEAYGIKRFTSEIINITYVAATTATSIDSVKLKKKYPDIAAECSRNSAKKAYIKIELPCGVGEKQC